MAEADELCDRIAIVDHGRILAIGTPAELRARVQRESIFRLELDRLDGGPIALARLPGVVKASAAVRDDSNGHNRQTVEVNLVLESDAALAGVVGALGSIGARIRGLRKSEPSLEDVFVELVGRGFEDVEDTPDAGAPPKTGDNGRAHLEDAETSEPVPTTEEPAEEERV
jgi:ABC-2 type transport system ATP-binding protein